MTKQPKSFKSSPRKYHPKGLTLLYEDHDVLVVDKCGELITVVYDNQPYEISAFELLQNYVKKGNSKSQNRIHMVHRLDRDTSGVLVFAKSEAARSYLIDQWSEFSKTYQAAVTGILPEKEGVITSYLAEGHDFKMHSVSNPNLGVKAVTAYRVLEESKTRSLLEIDLQTGKKNQIRVHLSEKGFPVVGDKKYGDKTRGVTRLALHAASLEIKHPHTEQPMSFAAPIPVWFASVMKS